MAVDIFLGEPPYTIKNWIISHSGGEDPDPVDTSEWGQIVAKLEDCQPSDFNMTNLTYVGSDAKLIELAVGSAATVGYKLNGTDTVQTRWLNMGFNASIPEYVKYRKTAGSGYKHVWVCSMKSSLLAPIAVGDTVYVRTFDTSTSDFTYIEETTVTAVGSATFTYGNNCTYAVPMEIQTADGKTYAFCGYNITLNSEATLEQVNFDPDASCFLPGTKITMADGTKKNIEDLRYGDVLKVWDFDSGTIGTAPVCWLTKRGLKNDHYYKLTFSDGTVLKTTGRNSNHKVYNVDEKFFKGVDKTQVGDRVYSENGIVTVTDKQYINEEVDYYNVMTSKKINCFAEGILTSDRYGNLYPISEQMTYVKGDRPVRPYSEFQAAGISEYWYEHVRLGESLDTVEKTADYIRKCENQMLPLSE